MSGQRSADDEGQAESVAAGCAMRETPSRRTTLATTTNAAAFATAASSTGPMTGRRVIHFEGDGLAVFTWGRGEDGQLGLGDTADQDEPSYVRTEEYNAK